VNKKTTLAEVQKKINKEQGDRALVALGDNLSVEVERIPTGILAVDTMVGGGFPRGKNIELMGPEGSGKTSIALRYIGEAQKFGSCVFIDLENALDPNMAISSGVNLDELFVAQPESAESALQIVEDCLGASDVSAIVIDSVAGLTPNAEINGDFGDSHVGLVARLMSQALRKLTAQMRSEKSDVTVIWINQLREKIGGMPSFGPQTTTTGGRALRYYSSIRLEVARTGPVKQGEDIIGHTVKVKSVKNRFAPPYQTATFDILYDRGISNESTLLEMALDKGLIKKSGAWFADAETGENLGQGKLKILELLSEDKELYERILAEVSS
jgi:recombination protein RecA